MLRIFRELRQLRESLALAHAQIGHYQECFSTQSTLMARYAADLNAMTQDLSRRTEIMNCRRSINDIFEARCVTYQKLHGMDSDRAMVYAMADPHLKAALCLCDALGDVLLADRVAREADALFALHALLQRDPIGAALDGVFAE